MGLGGGGRTGSFLRGEPYQLDVALARLPPFSRARPAGREGARHGGLGMGYPPTLEVASVSELSVLDLPALGFPTRPMRGSRGMLRVGGYIKRKEWKGCQSQWQ